MEDTSGFYLYQDGALTFAPNFVENTNFQLYRDQKDTHNYPVHGWYWFDTEDDARAFFNMPPKPLPFDPNDSSINTQV